MRHLLILVAALSLCLGCKNGKKSQATEQEKTEGATKNSVDPKIATNSLPNKAVNKDAEPASAEEPRVAMEPRREVQNYEPEIPDNLFLRIQRTSCFGQCPVYTVNIYLDGSAFLEGKQYFDYEGFYQSAFNEDHFNRVLDLVKRFGYMGFDHVYDAPVTDLPSTTTIVRTEEGVQWVFNRMNAPDELRKFEVEIETLIKDLQWFPYKPSR